MLRKLWAWLNRPSLERELFHELLESWLIVQLDQDLAQAFKQRGKSE